MRDASAMGAREAAGSAAMPSAACAYHASARAKPSSMTARKRGSAGSAAASAASEPRTPRAAHASAGMYCRPSPPSSTTSRSMLVSWNASPSARAGRTSSGPPPRMGSMNSPSTAAEPSMYARSSACVAHTRGGAASGGGSVPPPGAPPAASFASARMAAKKRAHSARG